MALTRDTKLLILRSSDLHFGPISPPKKRFSAACKARQASAPALHGVFSEGRGPSDTAQADAQRFFLPFEHHLRKIIEAPISACVPADGMRRTYW
jgi:hypothetical protein